MLLLLLATAAFGATPYLPNLDGILHEGITQVRTFTLTAGEIGNCVHKRASNWHIHQCAVWDASAQVTGSESGPYDTVVFEKAYIFEKTSREIGRFVEVVLDGTAGRLEEGSLRTPAKLILWYPMSSPDQVQGTLTLTHFGITRGIQAHPVVTLGP